MKCQQDGCDGRVEASAPIWFSLADDGTWSVYGIGDEAARITCDDAEHDNWTPALDKSLTAFIDERMPGTTWEGSAPGAAQVCPLCGMPADEDGYCTEPGCPNEGKTVS